HARLQEFGAGLLKESRPNFLYLSPHQRYNITMYHFLSVCLWLAMIAELSHSLPQSAPPQQRSVVSLSNQTVVFKRGEGGYYCIKIPSLVATAEGTLIAFGEGRMISCSDFTWTDLIYKRSTDGGKTWGPLTILYSNSSAESGENNVIGNAAPVVLRDTHRILMPFCRNNLQVLLTYSDDDGVSWSQPVNVSDVVHPSWSCYMGATYIP
ncbi:Sialidase-1, partial [Geodia barretti]